MLKLYFIAAENEDGESLDWFVKAETVEEAIKFWRAYFEEDDQPSDPEQVFEMKPDMSKPGLVGWRSDECEIHFEKDY